MNTNVTSCEKLWAFLLRRTYCYFLFFCVRVSPCVIIICTHKNWVTTCLGTLENLEDQCNGKEILESHSSCFRKNVGCFLCYCLILSGHAKWDGLSPYPDILENLEKFWNVEEVNGNL